MPGGWDIDELEGAWPMCEAQDDSVREPMDIQWLGFRTTFAQLKANGWDIKRVEAYRPNWRFPSTYNSHTKIYIRHTAARLMGRISYYPDRMPVGNFVLDFLTPDKQVLGRVKKWIWDKLTQEDVPEILSQLAKLADETNPPKLEPKPVIDIEQYLKQAS